MNDFEKIPEQDIVSELFPNQEVFEKKVREALAWSEKGGPEVGTRSFIKQIYNEDAEGKLTPEKFGELKKRIGQEVKRIKEASSSNSEQREPKQGSPEKENPADRSRGPKKKPDEGKAFTDEETERMINDAEKMEWREKKRSGGVDPNET